MQISTDNFNAYVAGIRDVWNKGDRDETLLKPFDELTKEQVSEIMDCVFYCPKFQLLTGREPVSDMLKPSRIARALVEPQVSKYTGKMMLTIGDYMWHVFYQAQNWAAEDTHMNSVVIRSTMQSDNMAAATAQQPKQELETLGDKITVEDAQKEWKALVQSKKETMSEMDIKIKEAKQRYQSVKASLAKGK